MSSENVQSVANKERYTGNTGGPHGLGDPDDKRLRKVEIDVMIPKKMREKARLEKCVQEVAEFSQCGREAGLAIVFNCRQENAILKQCLTKWYHNDEFRQQCKEEYLEERSEYRRTGVPTKERQQRVPNSM